MQAHAMPWAHRLLFGALVILVSLTAAQAAPRPTRWRSPDGRPRPCHPAPPTGQPLLGETLPSRAGTRAPGDAGWRGRICLVVADGVFADIASDLEVFRQDLEAYGYATITYRFVSGDAESLRGYLQARWAEPESLVGAEFIGNLPYVVFEMMQDWGDGREYEDFACDLYFMDMDGAWTDARTDGTVAPGNGKLDTWSEYPGALEIWVSRIDAKPLIGLGSEAALLRHYLQKDHRFRTGALHPAWGSLLYPDDDWAELEGPGDQANAEFFYPASQSVLVIEHEQTTAADYLARFAGGFEYLHTRSHGYSGGHGYYEQDYGAFNWVYPTDYTASLPPALFYSFFVCSGSDYTAEDNLAGTVVLSPGDSGLFAWGSTKTGGMWNDCPFLLDISTGASFGAAFTDWFGRVAGCYPDDAPRWWYGMVLIGDGTLPALLFGDVPRSQWAAAQIEALARAGIVRGMPDATYRPTDPVTRAAMAVYIARAMASPPGEAGLVGYTPPADPTFSDVTATSAWSWCRLHVEYIAAHGVTGGYDDGLYHPERLCTRDQMAVYLARAFHLPPS